mmetsp:Transcript_13954/g.30876  ORF Transcript_13954/g.30876 Transcript_13954/m.30876 type:complete len:84 (-) Transcript_13954:349-600(-)
MELKYTKFPGRQRARWCSPFELYSHTVRLVSRSASATLTGQTKQIDLHNALNTHAQRGFDAATPTAKCAAIKAEEHSPTRNPK